MDKTLKIAPSTDPIKSVHDIVKYAESIKHVADFLHCDIMDGEFVENKTYSYTSLSLINEKTLLPLDVHLMIKNPHKYIDKFLKAGANILTIHYEAYSDKKQLINDLKYIGSTGTLAGLSIKPKTPISEIIPYLSFLDVVLVMSVEPGKSGQPFIDDTYQKVVQLNKIKSDYDVDFLIEVDGGINPTVSQNLKRYGANILVSGSYVYNSENKQEAIKSLRWHHKTNFGILLYEEKSMKIFCFKMPKFLSSIIKVIFKKSVIK